MNKKHIVAIVWVAIGCVVSVINEFFSTSIWFVAYMGLVITDPIIAGSDSHKKHGKILISNTFVIYALIAILSIIHVFEFRGIYNKLMGSWYFIVAVGLLTLAIITRRYVMEKERVQGVDASSISSTEKQSTEN